MSESSSFDDAELLDRAVRGEPLAAERLLLGYQGRLLARIKRKLPKSLAGVVSPEDVLQDTFVEVLRRIRSFQPSGSQGFARWLILIADCRLIDAIRSRQCGKRSGAWQRLDPKHEGSSVVPLLEMLCVDSHSPSRSAAGHEIEAAVQEAVGRLKPEYAEAVRLRFLQGLEVSEVASRMGRSEWSVHKLCSRGLKRLCDALGDPSQFFSRN